MEPHLSESERAKMHFISTENQHMDRLRLFVKHLSYILKNANCRYNITKSVIKEIDAFRMNEERGSQFSNHTNKTQMQARQPILYQPIRSEIARLRGIVCGLSNEIMTKYQLQKIMGYRPFRHQLDQRAFEEIFIAIKCVDLPFDIHFTISFYAVGKIEHCYNPHKYEKELLLLHETQHKYWFLVDIPANAVVCSRCFRKYVKQCHGCKQIVLSNTINSLNMDGKWYCTQKLRCVLGFGDDYVNP